MNEKLSSINTSAQNQFDELMSQLEKRYGKEEIDRLSRYAKSGQSTEGGDYLLTTSYRSSYGD